MSEENERLYEETQRRLREVTTLYEASQACLSISDQKGLLTAIIKAAARATDAALGSVMLTDEEKGEYIFGAHYGLSEETIAAIEAELHIPLGEGLVGSVVTTGQPLVVADVTTDPRWISVETKEPMHSFLGVPLVGRDRQPLGALTLSHPEVGAFDEDHAKLLSTFANQAAMAIENARLYEQAQQEITERKQVLEALRENEERYRRLVGLSFEAIVIHREGKIVYINAAGAQLLGASSPEELIGKPILDFVHPDYLEMAKARVLRVTEGRVAPLVEEKLIRLDGTRVDAEAVGIPITYQGQPAVQVVIRDITERKRAEEALRRAEAETRRQLKQQMALREAGAIISSTLDLETVLSQIAEQMGRAIDATSAYICSYEPETITSIVWAEYIGPQACPQERVSDLGATYVEDDVETEIKFLKTVQAGEPDISHIDDPNLSESERAHMQQYGGQTVLYIPLLVKGQFLGFAELWESRRRREFTSEEIALCQGIAQQAAVALENARLYEQAQQEIAERKRVEQALRESELQYRTTLDSMGDAIHVVDTDLRFILINTACKKWNKELGLETDVISRTIFEVFPFLPDKVHDEYRRVFDTGKTLITDESTKVEGREFITETRKIPVFEGGKVVQVVTVIRDITERKRAEEALRESEERFRQMAEISPFPVSIIDPAGRYEYVNPKFIEVFGYTLEDIPSGEEWFTRAYPDPAYRQEAISTWLSDLEQYGEYEVRSRTFSVTCKDRTFRDILFRPATMKDGKQFIIYEDITERKRAEETLRESEEKYRALFEQANDAVFLETLDGHILDVNERACQLLGYERQELLRLTVADIVPPEVREMLPQIIQEHIDRGGVRLEAERLRKDGSRVAVEVSTALLEIGGQNLVLALVRDITERKKLEEQLRQAQKMEAIGTLAGGIAHDFNNILTGILGFASVVYSELPADNPLRPDVETIIRSAQRASELTRQLLTFARRGQVEVRPLSLNDIALEVIRLLKRTIDKAIAIEPYLASDLATVEGNAGQLQQMLLNLCLNARDAMPQGGRLVIETQNVTLSEEKVHIELDLEAGQYILLSVTDTGSGMDAGTQQRLFEPFFTTKEHGRGLGLAMVYGIVRGHGGTIHVYSEPGQGSTFKVYLPAASRPAEDAAPEEAEVVGGSETVLVIDDEEPVRVLLRRILEEGGYTVLLATDGVEAVELYTGLSTEIDLVVLDIIMPRMGGRETYERLREINPEVKVLLSSGYSENGQAQDILAAGAGGFLQKPYDPRAVLRKVREVLDSIDNVSSSPTRQRT